MAKPKAAAEQPDTQDTQDAQESRADVISRMIPKIAESCSYDMDNGSIFGRVMTRLKDWGASDEEISEKVGEIRKAVDAHIAQRTAQANDRARAKAARDQAAIGKALGD